ncbi:hypothetical protein Ddye_027878 [Dipteronia dyeriana]|uniref:Jacalin-type lectin domain-containing protein n=1 Tax=Dipteronia dyeriana TaxID=168575 RepID=A0AAD9WRV6_9ROSI|nr:hypothetical protein Ddye_027878 [Dipteronia dyeriana]
MFNSLVRDLDVVVAVVPTWHLGLTSGMRSLLHGAFGLDLAAEEVEVVVVDDGCTFQAKRINELTQPTLSWDIAIGMPHQGTIKLGPWGGAGGAGWDFNPGADSSITDIQIGHGEVVDHLFIKSLNRKTGQIESGTHGGSGGANSLISINRPEEHITSISGTTKYFGGHVVIESLTFQTNKTVYGPYGLTTGDAFGIPIEFGEVVGFFGRAGLYIDAIGVYVKPSP